MLNELFYFAKAVYALSNDSDVRLQDRTMTIESIYKNTVKTTKKMVDETSKTLSDEKSQGVLWNLENVEHFINPMTAHF